MNREDLPSTVTPDTPPEPPRGLMARFRTYFLTGLIVAGPIAITLYLTWWFPSYYRSRMMGIFQSASVISLIVGPPVSAYLLTMHGWLGLQGWQWLFLIEALPAIIMSVVTWVLLTDRPKDARWLRPEQRSWLQQRLDSEQSQRESVHRFELGEMMLKDDKPGPATSYACGIDCSKPAALYPCPDFVGGHPEAFGGITDSQAMGTG